MINLQIECNQWIVFRLKRLQTLFIYVYITMFAFTLLIYIVLLIIIRDEKRIIGW